MFEVFNCVITRLFVFCRGYGEFDRGGSFEYESHDFKYAPCGKHAITHVDNDVKSGPFTFMWRPPDDFNDDVFFTNFTNFISMLHVFFENTSCFFKQNRYISER